MELPDPIEGYVPRPQVEERCALMSRRLTVLHAPGGFGKTAMLGRCCRNLREQGTVVAWVSFDEKDGPESVATYLALAFERAGLETFLPAARGVNALRRRCWTPWRTVRRTTGSICWCARSSTTSPRARSLSTKWSGCGIRRPSLRSTRFWTVHHAISTWAWRFGKDRRDWEIAMFALEGTRDDSDGGGAALLTARTISRFFDRRLSRRELAELVANSAGWPIALRIYRNAGRQRPPIAGAYDGGETIAGWIETRLWRGISVQDREFLFNIALFDWIDPDLIEEATGTRNSGRRLSSMGALAGLLSTTGGSATAMRLHPLIKDYCEKRCFAEAPVRFRAIHRGIARALARRGRVVEALRHAVEAGDKELLGRIGESTGGVRLWLEQGLQVLRTVDGLLKAEVLSTYPRHGAGSLHRSHQLGGYRRREAYLPRDGRRDGRLHARP